VPTVIPDGFGEATYQFVHTGVQRPMFCVIGHDVGTVEDGVTTATALRDIFWTAWDQAFEDSAKINGVVLRWRQGGVLNIAEAPPVAASGTGGGFEVTPPNTAMKIIKRTGLAGQHQRGAIFFPPWIFGEGVVDGAGLISGTAVAVQQTNATSWLNALASASLDMVLLHDSQAASTTPTPVTQLVVRNRMATQRRRIKPLS
jgi:hypothetical protein